MNIAGFLLTIRPGLSIARLKLKDVVGQTSYSGDDVTQMFAAMGNLEFPLAGGLYVLAGGGILSMSLADAATAASGDVSASKSAFDAGAGLRFRLGGASGFVEAKMGSASYEQGKFGFSSAQFIPITFGLIF